MINIALIFLKKFNLKVILIIFGVLGIVGTVYLYHFKPLKNLNKEIKEYEASLIKKDTEINNLQELLEKCHDDLNTRLLELKIYHLKDAAYQEDSSTVKDFSNEGYLVF